MGNKAVPRKLHAKSIRWIYLWRFTVYKCSITTKVPTKPETKGQNLRLLPGFFTVKLFSLKLIGFSPENGWNMKDPFWGNGLFSMAMLVSGRLHELLIEKLTTEALSKWLRLQTKIRVVKSTEKWHENLHKLIGSLSLYLQGFVHPRWCLRISSIKSTKWNTVGRHPGNHQI